LTSYLLLCGLNPAKRPITTYPGGPLDTVLATIARRIGGTPGQVIFKWAHAKGFVVVTTTSRRTRLREYLDVVHLRASSSFISLHSLVVIFYPTFSTFSSGPHTRRNESNRRGRHEMPTSPHAVMATKTFVCSCGAHPCDTLCACDTVCDHGLVLPWMVRFAMNRDFLADCCCAGLPVSSRIYRTFNDVWCRRPRMNETGRSPRCSRAAKSPMQSSPQAIIPRRLIANRSLRFNVPRRCTVPGEKSTLSRCQTRTRRKSRRLIR
jgi:hypothetical protein